jgi:multisubunit Na+/H+ antiporter MnhF subunit
MNVWLIAASATTATLIPTAWMALRGKAEQRLVGLEMTGLVLTLALVMFTVGFGRLPFIDLAVTLAVLSFGSGLVFARFLEKHL